MSRKRKITRSYFIYLFVIVFLPLLFYQNLEKALFTSMPIKKCRKCLEINIVYFALAQFHLKKAMSQLLRFDIECWRSYRPFLFKQLQLIKIKSHHCCVTLLLLNAILYKMLSQWHHFQPQNHTVMASSLFICLYLSIKHWGLCCWKPPWLFHFFFECFFFILLLYVFPGIFKT